MENKSMPTYGFSCKNCGQSFEKQLLVESRNLPESQNCPFCNKRSSIYRTFETSGIADPVRIGVKKGDGAIKEVLTEIKKAHPLSNFEVR